MGSRETCLALQLTTAPQCSLCHSAGDRESTMGTTWNIVTSSESEPKVDECRQSSIFGKWLLTGTFRAVQLTICWSNVFQKSLVRLSHLSIARVWLLAARRCDGGEDRKSIQQINKSVQRNHSLNFMSPRWKKKKKAQGRDWKGFKRSRGDSSTYESEAAGERDGDITELAQCAGMPKRPCTAHLFSCKWFRRALFRAASPVFILQGWNSSYADRGQRLNSWWNSNLFTSLIVWLLTDANIRIVFFFFFFFFGGGVTWKLR